MKVKIKSYPTTYNTWWLIEKLPLSEKWQDKLGDYIPENFWYDKLANKFYKWQQSRRVSIKLDEYDSWDLHSTLGYIALPLLKQLKETTHGAPYVDPEDVPEELRPSQKAIDMIDQHGDISEDENHFVRWDWILDEMIFAFEHVINEDWIVDCWITKPKGLDDCINGEHIYEFEKYDKIANRVQNGFRLFGIYYQNLWD